jgi:hypothetical protein
VYRDDLAATHARLEAIERDLSTAQSQAVQDRQRIAMLTAELQGTRQAMARLNAASRLPPYGQPFPLPPRSGTVLTLGVLSLVLCHILGPFAWSMGTEELRRIDNGLAPPHGRSSASAGRICGIVATCLLCFSLLMIMFLVLAAPR